MEHKGHSSAIPNLRVSLTSRHFGTLGGLEKYGYRIAKAFTRRGAHVDIVTSDTINKSGSPPLIHFHSLPPKKWLNFRKVEEFDRACKKWLEKQKFDVIFGMDRTRYQTHIRAGNGVHLAFMKEREKMEGKGGPFKPFLNPLNETILKIEKEAFENPELKRLFTNSYMVKKEILSYYKTPADKIQVVHNGVEWEEMHRDFSCWLEKKETICHEFGLDPFKYHFLFVGSGFKRKGLAPLLKGVSLLSSQDFHLSIVGKEKKVADFIKLAKQLGVENKVSFFGPRSDISRFYQYADSLVIPSFYDPFANVTVEALAMGLFVVTSKTNGGYEIIKKENGTLIDTLVDPQAIAKALETAFQYPKTWISSQNIRNSVKYLDFSNQLETLIDATLDSIHA
jgi:UDP-glucose:(heptosyl)LPS alpha-1,3-glucosyltransferase